MQELELYLMRKYSMFSKDNIKALAYFVGRLLGILGVAFVLYQLSQEYTLESFAEKFGEVLFLLFPLWLLNMLSMMLGIFPWHTMLLHYSKVTFPYRVSYYYFAKTEIAKYLPGNIFHFLGRQLLAKKIHLSQAEMMKVSGLFTFLLVVATVLSGTLFLLFVDALEMLYQGLMLLLALVVLGLSLSFFPSFDRLTKLKMSGVLTLSIALQGIMMGIIIVAQLEGGSMRLFFEIVGIYIFSWLVGFVTPGASGGIGVREGAFITMAQFLQLDISSEIILFSVLFIRLVNVATDLSAYGSTYLIKDGEYI